jgi:hypothetical protein
LGLLEELGENKLKLDNKSTVLTEDLKSSKIKNRPELFEKLEGEIDKPSILQLNI